MDRQPHPDMRHLACIGLMGAGKTTVGQRVASSLGWGFIDVDEEIAARAGCSAGELWDVGGEDVYRPLEREIVSQVLAATAHMVLATPGCVVLDADATCTIRAGSAVTVYLRARPDTLARRLLEDPRTGSVLDLHPEDALWVLFQARDRCYVDLADQVVQVDDLDVNAATSAVLTAVEGWLPVRSP